MNGPEWVITLEQRGRHGFARSTVHGFVFVTEQSNATGFSTRDEAILAMRSIADDSSPDPQPRWADTHEHACPTCGHEWLCPDGEKCSRWFAAATCYACAKTL